MDLGRILDVGTRIEMIRDGFMYSIGAVCQVYSGPNMPPVSYEAHGMAL